MKVSIDTKEDSHDDIRKVIRMLQNVVGESQEVFTNSAPEATQPKSSPMANIFGDISSGVIAAFETAPQESQLQTEEKEEAPQSTDDLFAELFSEEELKKMDVSK